MAEYENVVGGKLRLKGRALDVKGSRIGKKKKSKKQSNNFSQPFREDDSSTGSNLTLLVDDGKKSMNHSDNGGDKRHYDDNLTPAERRYLQQWEKIDLQRIAKMASKSHRDRIHDFNQYLANLSEHHDIPKVGPG